MEQVGPTVTVSRSCRGCVHCKTHGYIAQGDSGYEVACGHPSLGRRFIADTRWETPDWCPVAPLTKGGE